MSYLPFCVPASFGHSPSQSFSRTTGCTQFPVPEHVRKFPMAMERDSVCCCTRPLNYILLQRRRTTTPNDDAENNESHAAHCQCFFRALQQYRGMWLCAEQRPDQGTQRHVRLTLRETQEFFATLVCYDQLNTLYSSIPRRVGTTSPPSSAHGAVRRTFYFPSSQSHQSYLTLTITSSQFSSVFTFCLHVLV